MSGKELAKREKLWSLNFFLIWQGQLVSAFGDVAYEIALGFWILSTTGSKALMGILMAASAMPKVLISPLAGVIVDRKDRKKLLVIMDLIRGLCIVFVGIAAWLNFIEIWMVFIAGIVMGICAAFFNPAVASAIPDIVPDAKLTKANANLGMIRTGVGLVGNPIGGMMYQLLGAPIMFLTNGISYLFSAGTEIFIKIPKSRKQGKEFSFWSDLKEGFDFVWKFKGLRNLIFIAAFLNFFAKIAIILILPMFKSRDELGAGKYGIALGILAGGMFLGMFFTSLVNIKSEKRFVIFMSSGIISGICFSIFPYFNNFIAMLLVLIGAGASNAILNVMIDVGLQLTIPQDMRGKVYSLMGTVLSALSPIAMVIGGIMAEFILEQYIITASFTITVILFIPFLFIPSFKGFINYNPSTQKISDIA